MLRTHALYEMAADLGSEVARHFAGLYLSNLDERLERLRAALGADDPVETYTAAVSLYTASWMVGAEPVAEAAHALAEAARSRDMLGARGHLPELEDRVPGAVQTLTRAVSELV